MVGVQVFQVSRSVPISVNVRVHAFACLNSGCPGFPGLMIMMGVQAFDLSHAVAAFSSAIPNRLCLPEAPPWIENGLKNDHE
jgi:hypothetical protein